MKGKFGKAGLLCLAVLLALVGVGVGLAHWQETLTIEETVETGTWELGGTPGFWGNWDSHNTYPEGEIVGFLAGIGSAPGWLYGITDVSQMEAVFAAGEAEHATMEAKFLRQYLATRLNDRADRLYHGTFHLFSIYDPSTGDYPYGYLGLDGAGTLPDIIDAIEDKYPDPEADPPTDGQFEIMKNICDALNNLTI